MEKVQADLGQQAVVALGVNCNGGCVRDELEESELMMEGGDEEKGFLKSMATADLASSVASFSGFFHLFETYCCANCQKFENPQFLARSLLPQFRAHLQEAKEELKRRKPLKEM